MPTISVFYGIVIRMYFNDHAPPHFHARYGEFEATVKIEDLAILEGHLPMRALELVKAWAAAHQAELAADWEHCRAKRMPAKIDPLV
jgi:Domain of unknown function (DUF4160)